MLDLSIIIVNYRSGGLVKTCLRGILRSNLKCAYETIVVDNDSRDDSVDQIKQHFPGVRLIESKSNRGLAAGNNLGIRAAQGRYLLIINPDIALFPGEIERLIDFMDRHDRVALAGPKLINPDGSIQTSCYRFPEPLVPLYRRTPLGKLWFAKKTLHRYLLTEMDRTKTRPVDWVLGACMLVRKSAVDQVGVMDERYFLYFEDVDWCRRFWAAGFQVVFFADSKLIHYHRRLSAESPGLSGIFTAATRIHIQSGLRYFLKYWRVPLPDTALSI